jgi:hypothetical protein
MLLQKNDGTWGLFIDYWELNKITVWNRYLIPRIHDLMDQLKGVEIFQQDRIEFWVSPGTNRTL